MFPSREAFNVLKISCMFVLNQNSFLPRPGNTTLNNRTLCPVVLLIYIFFVIIYLARASQNTRQQQFFFHQRGVRKGFIDQLSSLPAVLQSCSFCGRPSPVAQIRIRNSLWGAWKGRVIATLKCPGPGKMDGSLKDIEIIQHSLLLGSQVICLLGLP